MKARLDVAVLGAGIAGLTAAAFLGRAAIPCTVYEQARELGDVGAGIQLAPNAVSLLRRIGAGADLDAAAVRPEEVTVRRWQDGSVIARTTLGATCEQRYGAPYLTVHRADLHRILVRLARSYGADIVTGHRCVSVSPAPAITFDNGLAVEPDLVVGADGIRSVARAALVDDQPRYRGTTVYRGLVPAHRLRDLGEPRVDVWLGPGQHCVWYPVDSGRCYSLVAAVPSGHQDGGASGHGGGRGGGESWRTPGDVDDVLAAYRGWPSDVTSMIAAADGFTRWTLHDRPVLRRWHRGSLAVIGDAAHPMLPFGAHGANQAIEDAATLATCVATSPDGLQPALRRYASLRMPRVAAVSAIVQRNAADHHLTDGADQAGRDRAMGDRIALQSLDWLYGYDAQQAAATSVPAPRAASES